MRVLNGPGYKDGERDDEAPYYLPASEVVFELELANDAGEAQTGTLSYSLYKIAVENSGTVTLANLQPGTFPEMRFADLEDGQYWGSFYVRDSFDRRYSLGFGVDAKAVEDFDVLVANNFQTHHRAVVIPVVITKDDSQSGRNALKYRVDGADEWIQRPFNMEVGDRTLLDIGNLTVGDHSVDIRFIDTSGNLSLVTKAVNFSVTDSGQNSSPVYRGIAYKSFGYKGFQAQNSIVHITNNGEMVLVPTNESSSSQQLGYFESRMPYWVGDLDEAFYRENPLQMGGAQLVYQNDEYSVFHSTAHGHKLITFDLSDAKNPKLIQFQSLQYSVQKWHPFDAGRLLGFRPDTAEGLMKIISLDFSDPLDVVQTDSGITIDNTSEFPNMNWSDIQLVGNQILATSNDDETIFQMKSFTINDDLQVTELATSIIDLTKTRVYYPYLNDGQVVTRVRDLDEPYSVIRVYNHSDLSQIQEIERSSDCYYLTIAAGSRIFCGNSGVSYIYGFNGSQYERTHTIDRQIMSVVNENTVETYNFNHDSWIRWRVNTSNLSRVISRELPVGMNTNTYKDEIYLQGNSIIAVGQGVVRSYPKDNLSPYQSQDSLRLSDTERTILRMSVKVGDFLYVYTNNWRGPNEGHHITQIDISNPSNLRVVDSIRLNTSNNSLFYEMVFSQGYIYVFNSREIVSLEVLNTGALNQTDIANLSPGSSSISDVELFDNSYIFFTHYFIPQGADQPVSELAQIDIRSPGNPSFLRSIPIASESSSSSLRRLVRSGNRMLTYHHGSGVSVISVNEQGALSESSSVDGIFRLVNQSFYATIIAKEIFWDESSQTTFWFFSNRYFRGHEFQNLAYPDWENLQGRPQIGFFETSPSGNGAPQVVKTTLQNDELFSAKPYWYIRNSHPVCVILNSDTAEFTLSDPNLGVVTFQRQNLFLSVSTK